MFKFLKEKLKNSVSAFTKKIDETGDEEVVEEIKEEPVVENKEEVKEESSEEEVREDSTEKDAKEDIKVESKEEKSEEEIKEEKTEEVRTEEEPKKKEGFFKRLFHKKEKTEEEIKEEEVKEEIEKVRTEDSTDEIGGIEIAPDVSDEDISEEPAPKEEEPEKPVPKKEEVISESDSKEEKAPEEEKVEAKKEIISESEVKEEEREPAEEKVEPQVRKETLPDAEIKEKTQKDDIVTESEITETPFDSPKEEIPETKEEVQSDEIKEETDETVPEKVKTEIKGTVKPEEKVDAPEKKKGFFGMIKEKVVTKKINNEKFEEMFWDLEVALLENNVAVQVIDKIKTDLKNEIVDNPIKRNKIEDTILNALKTSIGDVLSGEKIDILEKLKEKKPYVICFVGINGSGKTTTIAKVAKLLIDNNKKVVLAAADTFRAAAIDQLQIHADNLGVKMIKHDYGSDPAAVAFDAIKYAESKDADVVLIDTAGRLHSNSNLVEEMKKIIRVANPDLKLFVGEAITGNDCVEQAVKFDEAINIDGVVLSKADIDEKGGASISVSYVTKKPVAYIGTGQEYTDIKPFDKDEIIASLGLT